MAKYLDEIALAVAVVATGGAALAAFAPAAFGGLGASIGAATGIGTAAGAGTAGATAGAAGGTVGGLTAGGTATGATLGEVAAAGGAEVVAGGQAASSFGTATTAAEGAAAAEAAGGSAGLFGTGVTGSQAIQGAGAVAAIGGGYQQKVQNEAATRAQRRQNMFAGRLRDLQVRREVLTQVNSANVERASVQNRAAQTGGQGSSGESGSVSSIASQLGANVSFLDQGKQLQSDIFGQAQRAQTAGERAGMAGSVAKLGLQFGQGVFNDVFTG